MSAEPWYIQYSGQIIAIVSILVTIIITIIGWKRVKPVKITKIENGNFVPIQQVEQAENVFQFNIDDSSHLSGAQSEIEKKELIIGNRLSQTRKITRDSLEQLIKSVKKSLFDPEEPLSSILAKCHEIAKKLDKKKDVFWLEKELYGTEKKYSGFPQYRRINAELNMTFLYQGGKTSETYDNVLAIGYPIIRIEQIIKNATFQHSTQLIFWHPTSKNWLKLAKKHGGSVQEKMPYIVKILALENILNRVRLRVHKFISNLN